MSDETLSRVAAPELTNSDALVASIARYRGAITCLAATAWWLLEVTRAWAGWDAPAVTVGAALVALAVLVVRPDRILPPFATATAAAISVGAFIVPLTAPTGWAGARGAASYVCAAWLCVTVAAVVAAQPETRAWFVTLVMASAPVEFLSGWMGWWGGDNPSRVMVGTFYWHNPFGAFLVPGGILGLAFWIWRQRIFALLGIITFIFTSIGVVYSTSRASLAIFVLGFVAIAAMCVLDRGRVRAIRQLVIAAVIAAGATFAIGGPPFFSHRASPLAGEHVRAAGQSLGQNSGYRLDFWREALTVFGHHPLTGGGYKSLVSESLHRVPSDWPLSPFAHNGYLQAVGEGGLVLALPFLLGVGWVAWFLLRFLVTSLRTRRPSISRYAVPVALGCVLLHAGVDFDWIYPASFALAGILAGLVLGRAVAPREAAPAAGSAESGETGIASRRRTYVGAASALVGVALLVLAAVEMRNGDHHFSLPTSNSAVSQAAPDSGR